jgi:hypothetical protein
MPEAQPSIKVCVTVEAGGGSVNVAVSTSGPRDAVVTTATETGGDEPPTAPGSIKVSETVQTMKPVRDDYPYGFNFLNDLEPEDIPEQIRKCTKHEFGKRGSNKFISKWTCKKCGLVCVHHLVTDEKDWNLS